MSHLHISYSLRSSPLKQIGCRTRLPLFFFLKSLYLLHASCFYCCRRGDILLLQPSGQLRWHECNGRCNFLHACVIPQTYLSRQCLLGLCKTTTAAFRSDEICHLSFCEAKGQSYCFLCVSMCFQVKLLYQGVLEKLQLIHPRLITEERMGEGYERMRMEVEREVVRRKSLGAQLRTLLDSQLQVSWQHCLQICHYNT